MKNNIGLIVFLFIIVFIVCAVSIVNNRGLILKIQKAKETNESKVINFDRTKCINSDFTDEKISIGRTGMSESINGLTFSIDENDEKNVNIQIRYDMIYPDKYTEDEIRNKSIKYYDAIKLKFAKRVDSIFGGVLAPDYVDGLVYIFLLEDGSIEYMKYSDIYNSKKYESEPIKELNDIIKFDNVTLNSKEDGNSKYTIIAYKIDGTYYDLSEFIKID